MLPSLAPPGSPSTTTCSLRRPLLLLLVRSVRSPAAPHLHRADRAMSQPPHDRARHRHALLVRLSPVPIGAAALLVVVRSGHAAADQCSSSLLRRPLAPPRPSSSASQARRDLLRRRSIAAVRGRCRRATTRAPRDLSATSSARAALAGCKLRRAAAVAGALRRPSDDDDDDADGKSISVGI
ncbi:hypothetical protein Scep_010138 [Stephania cephalantha]|uniref:Uncharacterized protein n=1 Tax=Stephania cephalantha TaxID=152367 RepID=A0AAP0JUI8_9MAGN